MSKKQKPVQYQDLPEVLKVNEAASLVRVSRPILMSWLISGKSPYGPIIEGVHYIKLHDEYRITKDRLCELVGILPKVQVNDNLIVIGKSA